MKNYVEIILDRIEYKNNNLTVERITRGIISFGFRSSQTEFGIKVPKGQLDRFKLKTVSSNSCIEGVNAIEVNIKSTSGDLMVSNLSSPNIVSFSTVSGDIEINGLTALGLENALVSGNLEGSSIKIENEIVINSVSGDVELNNVKVNNINHRSVSGDFDGEEVYCETVQFRSVSGDFEIINSNHDEEIVVTSNKSVSGDLKIK